DEAKQLYALPFLELLYRAQTIHREHHDNAKMQLAALYNVKTGACPEDCGYCTQSRHYKTGLKKESLVSVEKTLEQALEAKNNGATRFCIGAAWRSPTDPQLNKIIEMVKGVKDLGLESCVTLGMLQADQAKKLKEAGVDFYNHNLDTSPNYYPEVVTTRTYADRIETLKNVREAGLKVCCGGILGMGESEQDRIELIHQLANLDPYPESVPINHLHPVPGTRLGNSPRVADFDFIRIIALARIMMPKCYVRLTAGRVAMSQTMQALCFFAGANSIFLGPKLLVVTNPELQADHQMLQNLGIEAQTCN
ncbi:MAG TPA: biotin synthase BioB, partial [Gammaproteobacteria bacterium]|nr:biotin synthase BioB [Gammaproteobacteria bacterium]